MHDFLDLVLANNTDIQIQRLNVEQPRNAILRGFSVFDPLVMAAFTTTRRETPSNDALAGAQHIESALRSRSRSAVQQMLPTGTTYNVEFNDARLPPIAHFRSSTRRINSGFNANIHAAAASESRVLRDQAADHDRPQPPAAERVCRFRIRSFGWWRTRRRRIGTWFRRVKISACRNRRWHCSISR